MTKIIEKLWMDADFKPLPGPAGAAMVKLTHDDGTVTYGVKPAQQATKELKVVKFKGGKGSGNFAHAGRPGKIGGSVVEAVAKPLTSDQMLAWNSAVNVGEYDKLIKLEHGEELLHVMENAVWTDGKENFLKQFDETVDAPPKAKKTKTASIEGMLYAITAMYKADNRPRSAIDWYQIRNVTGWDELDFDHNAYSAGLNQFMVWEHTHGLNQLRVRSSMGYVFDSKNGIITKATALRQALKASGYNTPEKAWKIVESYKPS